MTTYSGTKSGKWSISDSLWSNVPKSMEKQEMAVLIEFDMSLKDLMEKLGCDAGLILDVHTANLKAAYQTDGVLISMTEKTPQKVGFSNGTVTLAPIKLGVLQKIVQNDPSFNGTAKNVAKIQLQKHLKLLLQGVDYKGMVTESYDGFAGGDVHSLDPIPAPVAAKDLSTVFGGTKGKPILGPGGEFLDTEGHATWLKNKLSTTLPKTKLIHATELYQPVRGSDETSTYHAIALRPELKIAVRIKPDMQCSIRAEMNDTSPALKNALMKSGLKPSNSHYSMHFVAGSEDLIRKTIGAVLFNIGVNFPMMTLDLLPIWNKGT